MFRPNCRAIIRLSFEQHYQLYTPPVQRSAWRWPCIWAETCSWNYNLIKCKVVYGSIIYIYIFVLYFSLWSSESAQAVCRLLFGIRTSKTLDCEVPQNCDCQSVEFNYFYLALWTTFLLNYFIWPIYFKNGVSPCSHFEIYYFNTFKTKICVPDIKYSFRTSHRIQCLFLKRPNVWHCNEVIMAVCLSIIRNTKIQRVGKTQSS